MTVLKSIIPQGDYESTEIHNPPVCELLTNRVIMDFRTVIIPQFARYYAKNVCHMKGTKFSKPGNNGYFVLLLKTVQGFFCRITARSIFCWITGLRMRVAMCI